MVFQKRRRSPRIKNNNICGNPEIDNLPDAATADADGSNSVNENNDGDSVWSTNIIDGVVQKRHPRKHSRNSVGASKRKRNIAESKRAKSSCTTATDNSTRKSPPEVEGENLVMNDDVVKVKTAQKCAVRWSALFAARDSRNNLIINKSSIAQSNNNGNADAGVDAFDCSDLIIPPSYELVNREVESGIERWEDLASRVIIEEDGPTTNINANVNVVGKMDGENNGDDAPLPLQLRNRELLLDAAHRGDKRQQRLLPYNFDYACKKAPSSHENASTENGEGIGIGSYHCPRVVSLFDPTQTLDYKEELWQVFKGVRTSEELERKYALGNVKKYRQGTKKDEDDPSDDPVPHGCQHTLGVKNDLNEGLTKYSRLDAHSLGRLRTRERHSYSVGHAAAMSPSSFDTSVNSMGARNNNHDEEQDRTDHQSGTTTTTLQSTIQFEILRHSQNLKRGSGLDANRMEVECQGRHTLLDLHQLLVECSLDTASGAKNNRDENGDDDGSIHAGVFFIENTFYTCGKVGEGVEEAIQAWLDEKIPGSTKENDDSEEEALAIDEAPLVASMTPRRNFLRLSSCTKSIPMSEMNLEDLPHRLGVRYFHMLVPPPIPLRLRPNNMWFLGSELALYVTGIHTHSAASTNKVSTSMKAKVPITIHDTWAPSQRHTCLACNYSLASIVTINDPLTDAAPPGLDPALNEVHLQAAPLCSPCYQALHYQQSNQQGGEDDNNQPILEMRSSCQPSLVFSIEDYQRMVTVSGLDGVEKNSYF